jgi:signal transduction histidine kinase
LAAAICRFRNSERLFAGNPHQSHQDFLQGMQILEESLRDTRRLIDGLRPESLDESGVAAAIEKLVAQHRGPDSPQVELVDEAGLDGLAGPLENALFNIVRESLNNACRHSRSPRVRVRLHRDSSRLCVEVEDWGVGFDPARIDAGHFGLEGIRQRARLFGGKATIQSVPGQGTRILAELPLEP